MHFFIFLAFTALVGVIAYLATRNTDENSSEEPVSETAEAKEE